MVTWSGRGGVKARKGTATGRKATIKCRPGCSLRPGCWGKAQSGAKEGTEQMTDDERLAYIRAQIASRCPEVGRDALAPPEDTEEMLPASIVLQIVEVIDRMSERLAVYEVKFAEPEPLPARLH